MNKQVIINNLNTSKRIVLLCLLAMEACIVNCAMILLILICICLFMTILIISILGIQSLYVN